MDQSRENLYNAAKRIYEACFIEEKRGTDGINYEQQYIGDHKKSLKSKIKDFEEFRLNNYEKYLNDDNKQLTKLESEFNMPTEEGDLRYDDFDVWIYCG